MEKHCPVSCATILDSTMTTVAHSDPGQEDCKDMHPRCHVWAELGECDNNAEMQKYCASSCDTCVMAAEDDNLCKDQHENCRFWADSGECANNPNVRIFLQFPEDWKCHCFRLRFSDYGYYIVHAF